jgi:hypothetical protein
MGAFTNPDGLPYPGDADIPDVNADIGALAAAVQTALVARDAAIGDVESDLAANVLYGPISSLPSSLQPGQLYAGWA